MIRRGKRRGSSRVSGSGSRRLSSKVVGITAFEEVALNTLARRDKTLSERCFRALYGMPFGLGVLPNLRLRMAF